MKLICRRSFLGYNFLGAAQPPFSDGWLTVQPQQRLPSYWFSNQRFHSGDPNGCHDCYISHFRQTALSLRKPPVWRLRNIGLCDRRNPWKKNKWIYFEKTVHIKSPCKSTRSTAPTR
jgi:hypothetical protein